MKPMKADSGSEGARFGWRMPVCGVLAAVLIFVPLLISSSMEVLYWFLILPGLAFLGICVLIYAAMHKDLWVAVMVPAFFAVSAVMFIGSFAIRTSTRWLLWSGQYKKQVLTVRAPVNGDLKHIEWDGSGFAGTDTTFFLVFDPTNSLAAAAHDNQFGKFKGIPCDVSEVDRMDSHWYLVEIDFGNWDGCRFDEPRALDRP
ncbi:MAG: hypothetical protein ACRD4R_07250 [Candidatus Acidiferrales bacterium]